MLKLLITGALVYFAYRFFFGAPALPQDEPLDSFESTKKAGNTTHDDEYVDYEEVD